MLNYVSAQTGCTYCHSYKNPSLAAHECLEADVVPSWIMKIALRNHRASESKHLGPQERYRTTNETDPKCINKLPQCKNLCSERGGGGGQNLGQKPSQMHLSRASVHDHMQQKDQHLLNWACLPPGTLLSLLIGWINQSFLCRLSHFSTDWQTPGLLPAAQLWHRCLGFMCCRATGALEFATTVDVVCSPTGHVVVSPHLEPKIHCGIEFVFNFSIPC